MTLIGIPEVDREGYALEDDLRDAVRCALRSFGFRTPALDELLARIEHEYRATITGVRSSWNSHRLYLMRVLLKTEEEADQIVADTVSEIVRRNWQTNIWSFENARGSTFCLGFRSDHLRMSLRGSRALRGPGSLGFASSLGSARMCRWVYVIA